MNKREKQKEETLADILKISGELFQEVGYEKTTIQMIADKCGLSKGALYHHFRSKEEVLERICRDHYERAVALFLPIAREEGKSMMERFQAIMTVARRSQMNTAAATFVKENGKQGPSVENALLDKIFDDYSERIYREVFAPLFEEGRAAGECDFHGSAEVMAVFLHSLDSGMSRQLNEILFRPDSGDAEQRIADVIDGFSFALARILNIPKERIDEMMLAETMLEQYRKILQLRKSEH